MNFQVHNRTMKKWRKKKKMKKNVTLGWKLEKGGLEQKRENFWSPMGEANRRMKRQWLDSIRSLYEVLYFFQNQKSELSFPECLPLNSRVYHGRSWRLSNCHIQRLKKTNLFKILDFQRIHFLEKGMGNVPPLLFNQIVKINLLSRIIRSQINTPFEDF